MEKGWLLLFLGAVILIHVESFQGGCGTRRTAKHTFVIGGKDAIRGDWPWQVILSSNGRSFCGGTLINEYWVVTAAHCITQSAIEHPSVYSVGLGYHDRTNSNEGYRVDIRASRIIVHPGWNTHTINNDIALIQLERKVVFNQYVSPACLPTRNYVAPGTRCFITGFGKMHINGQMVQKLQQGEMPVVSQEQCESRNGQLKTVTPQMICAGNGGKTRLSGCHGDSGGPFVCNLNNTWQLVGAVSWGPSTCSSSRAYTVFARVHYFLSWIHTNMQQYGTPKPIVHNPLCSAWQQGDGFGEREQGLDGKFTAYQCISECEKQRKTVNPKINGATVPTDGTPNCYCEIAMTKVEPYQGYKTCWLLTVNGTDGNSTGTPAVPTDGPPRITPYFTWEPLTGSPNATESGTNTCRQYLCGDGRCIPSSWVCDNYRDCDTDEQNCTGATTTSNPWTTPRTAQCPIGLFRCPNGICKPKSWICDGDNDCGDGFDERNCSTNTTRQPWTTPQRNHTCSGFICPNGRCISHGWVCDGVRDCGSSDADERYCPTTRPWSAWNATTWRPYTTRQRNTTCYRHLCPNGRCISTRWVCDGDNDCGDGSDEQHCHHQTTRRPWTYPRETTWRPYTRRPRTYYPTRRPERSHVIKVILNIIAKIFTP